MAAKQNSGSNSSMFPDLSRHRPHPRSEGTPPQRKFQRSSDSPAPPSESGFGQPHIGPKFGADITYAMAAFGLALLTIIRTLRHARTTN